LLTIYDMCKGVDRKMQIFGVRLISKTKQTPRSTESRAQE
jgi:molybdenum cofactor biosynthesis enzyme